MSQFIEAFGIVATTTIMEKRLMPCSICSSPSPFHIFFKQVDSGSCGWVVVTHYFKKPKYLTIFLWHLSTINIVRLGIVSMAVVMVMAGELVTCCALKKNK